MVGRLIGLGIGSRWSRHLHDLVVFYFLKLSKEEAFPLIVHTFSAHHGHLVHTMVIQLKVNTAILFILDWKHMVFTYSICLLRHALVARLGCSWRTIKCVLAPSVKWRTNRSLYLENQGQERRRRQRSFSRERRNLKSECFVCSYYGSFVVIRFVVLRRSGFTRICISTNSVLVGGLTKSDPFRTRFQIFLMKFLCDKKVKLNLRYVSLKIRPNVWPLEWSALAMTYICRSATCSIVRCFRSVPVDMYDVITIKNCRIVKFRFWHDSTVTLNGFNCGRRLLLCASFRTLLLAAGFWHTDRLEACLG